MVSVLEEHKDLFLKVGQSLKEVIDKDMWEDPLSLWGDDYAEKMFNIF